ncbi:molybdopterin-dependent oxidoreductase [Phycicoccus endophyticus]|uniref:Molybdopterin-dependent oxidoreductase n=1 Tax=Phycicoccus endophyticus TaxID=1690220 RepID=A0A7G9R059_9MICO|nr:molybdopterin-dependent oxidoreductase [Phycicoccus endophyticus]NHI20225.1 molybdopterin-dependent oxidoreductase [Phycicoccus endophyticus]QNN48984.1 molybdopterin-dependent oxidoreductase [Phycicoccus endophyticus]GGL44265.1 oxidoreductase [Phycicoccus endophyticus]
MTTTSPTRHRPRARWYAAAALLATAAGAGVGHLVAGLVAPEASPVLAVGSTVVDLTPTPVKEWAVATLGTADKPVLVSTVAVVTLLLAAGVGALARTRRALGLSLLALLALLGLVAAASRPAAEALVILPGFVTAAVGLLGAGWLMGRLDALGVAAGDPAADGQAAPAPRADGTGARRSVLLAAGGLGVLAAAGGGLGQALVRRGGSTEVVLPAPAEPLPALPAGLERTVRGVSSLRTPASDFYRIDTALVVPRVDPDGWELRVDGMVERPYTLSWEELLAMPMVEKDVTLTCVSNEVGGPYVGGARWLGVRVRDLLERAGLRDGVEQVFSTSTDGMTISTPVQALTDDRDALVAVGMNGSPLPRPHGFPARLVTPGLYGFVGATKWLTRMTASTYAQDTAYWTERGWATRGTIYTQSRIDTPRSLTTLPAGRTLVGGVAWAQQRGIARVEVRVDEGEWRRATLGPDAGVDYWRQWYLEWDATPGRHTLQSRATDEDGSTQTPERQEPFPRGATGWHTVVVTVE